MRNVALGALLLVGSIGCERADDAPADVVIVPSSRHAAEQPAVSPVVERPKPVPPPKAATLVPPPMHDPMMWPGGPPQRPLREARAWFGKLTVDQRKDVKGACMAYRKDPCMGALRPFSDANPDPADGVLAQIGTDQRGEVYEYCAHVNRGQPGCDTPLVISFDDRPVEYTSSGTFTFEPGTPVATDWPTAATPWLAIDLDGDGAITSGRELFGDATLLPDGAKADNGFTALAALDANGDGVIDARDPGFGRLLLWADRDGDRRSTPAELAPLASKITALPLANHRDVRCKLGNCEGERGIAELPGGARATVIDVYLRVR